MYSTCYDSPVGKLLLTCREEGLTGIWFDRELPEPGERQDHHILQQTRCWLEAYFRGEDPVMDIPVALEGTAFQKRVWQSLLTIPYGHTRSYGDIAREMAAFFGKEKMSAQAVGRAVGKNPISILLPCHRVVGAKGQITGYGGGMERKIHLLCHEGRKIENNIVL